jgi:very-short-patch-repair endonuclease
MTPHEVKLWNWLREAIVPAGYRFRRQAPIDRFVVDFACLRARLVIEVDGEQHGLEHGLRRDKLRDERLAELGYAVLRFSNREIDREKPVVLDTIFAAVAARCEAHITRAGPTPVRAFGATRPSPAGEGSEGAHG